MATLFTAQLNRKTLSKYAVNFHVDVTCPGWSSCLLVDCVLA